MTDSTLMILNGPGLADLGAGGSMSGELTLKQIRQRCSQHCKTLGLELDFRQTDDEKKMSAWIAAASDESAGLIVNPGGQMENGPVGVEGYESAIAALEVPVIEVHLTNIFQNGATRPLRSSRTGMGLICGLGVHGYLLAITAIAKRLAS